MVESSSTELPLPEQAEVRRDPLNQSITSLKAPDLAVHLNQDPTFAALRRQGRYADLAVYFFSSYRALFRLSDPREELPVAEASADQLGYKHVRLRQAYAGLPVWGAELIVHFDDAGRIYLVNGHYLPTPEGLNRHPHVSETQALDSAAQAVGQARCTDCRSELVVFGVGRAEAAVAYRVSVRLGLAEQWMVFVDTQSGKILDRISAVPTATPDTQPRDQIE